MRPARLRERKYMLANYGSTLHFSAHGQGAAKNRYVKIVTMPLSLAYGAGLSKGGGAVKFKIMKTKRKISPLRISPFSCPKLYDQ